jgi:EmrB/QacA subfamily drug resistance transporter
VSTATRAAADVPVRTGRFDARTLTFAGVLAAIFLSALDQTIVGTAMPTIARELHGVDRYTWVTTAYLLTSTAVIPVVGKISEQLGRKRVFITAIGIFLLGSVLCGAAPTMNWLIFFRAFQGIGGGMIAGTAFAVIADLFTPSERGRYTGMLSGVFGIASVVGPLIGGALTDNVGWRWVFYVNVPVGIAVTALLMVAFPSRRSATTARPHIDWQGALLIGGAAAGLAYGISAQGTGGWTSPPVLISIALGLVLLVVGLFWEARAREAVLPPSLFKSPIFSVATAVMFLVGALMFGAITYIPVFLQYVVGVHATSSGLLLLPLMAGLVLASVVGGQILSRTGRYRWQAIIGSALVLGGVLLATRLDVHSAQGAVTLPMVVLGIGIGLSMPVYSVVSQNAVPQRLVSSATSTVQFVRQMGSVLGLAVAGSYFNARLAAVSGTLVERQAIAIHDVFLLTSALAAVALLISFFLREIPLRTSNETRDEASLPAAATA